MKVLSLFDGISGARVALNRLGYTDITYYSSEIDKYAISIGNKNHPKNINLGDVRTINGRKFKNIDLLIGGSPCQDLSISKKNRRGLQGDRSILFYEYLRLLKEVKPKYFLLENVASMSKESKCIISKMLQTEPIMINSALVSAQQRKRLYWTNIKNVTLPKDKKVYLIDILETEDTNRLKSYCIDSKYFKGIHLKTYFKLKKRQVVFEKPKRLGHFNTGGQGDRVYAVEGKSTALAANGGGRGAKTGLYLCGIGKKRHLVNGCVIRKLTPIECERLQNYPDNYTEGVSDSQRYKMLGNSFTVDIIKHILSFIKY